jgi:hypothetical protein
LVLSGLLVRKDLRVIRETLVTSVLLDPKVRRETREIRETLE